MEQKRTGLSYVFTLARGERGKLGVGMLLAVLCSAFVSRFQNISRRL